MFHSYVQIVVEVCRNYNLEYRFTSESGLLPDSKDRQLFCFISFWLELFFLLFGHTVLHSVHSFDFVGWKLEV